MKPESERLVLPCLMKLLRKIDRALPPEVSSLLREPLVVERESRPRLVLCRRARLEVRTQPSPGSSAMTCGDGGVAGVSGASGDDGRLRSAEGRR